MMKRLEIIDNYTKKLRVSGYKSSQAKEIIASGIRGYESKKLRAVKENTPFYRKAQSTLKQRIRKNELKKHHGTSERKVKSRKNSRKRFTRKEKEQSYQLMERAE